ncbi:MAG: hypothetical protein Q4B58_05810, partial [Bacteroidales bacterium]|nr:hypothetical protein [Bacteroidales bacterium]
CVLLRVMHLQLLRLCLSGQTVDQVSPCVGVGSVRCSVNWQELLNQSLQLSVQQMPVTTLSSIITACLIFGFCVMIFRVVRGQQTEFSLDAWKQPAAAYVKYVAVNLLNGFIIGIGLLCLILPGIYLACRLGFASYAIAENPEISIEDAYKQSWRMTRGNVLNVFLMGLVCFVVCIGGFLCCCIGLIPAVALCLLIVVVAYEMIKENAFVRPDNYDSGYQKEI